jgi:hypothetical protein
MDADLNTNISALYCRGDSAAGRGPHMSTIIGVVAGRKILRKISGEKTARRAPKGRAASFAA